MKRWVLCKTIFDPASNANEPAVSRYTDNFRCWNKSGFAWQVCQIGVQDLTQIDADPDIYVLPDVSLDITVGQLSPTVRQTLNAKAQAAGFDTSGIKLSSSLREVLMLLGRQLQPTMHPERGDVADA